MYQKFHSSPSLQYNLQKPYLISHFYWNILDSSGASANEWITRIITLQIWSIAPAGAVFSLFSFTEGTRPCGISSRDKSNSKMDRKALELCGIAAIGKTFICLGSLSFIWLYQTKRAYFSATFDLASSAKCAISSSDRADSCGPLITAACISNFFQLCPVLNGKPLVAYYNNLA